MKYVYCLLSTLVLALVSCSNRKQPSEYYPRSSSSYDSYTEPVKYDSTKYESTAPKPTESYSSSGRSKYEDKELDNKFFAPTFGLIALHEHKQPFRIKD